MVVMKHKKRVRNPGASTFDDGMLRWTNTNRAGAHFISMPFNMERGSKVKKTSTLVFF